MAASASAYRGEKVMDRTNPFADDLEEDFEHVNGDQIRNQMRLAQERSVESTKRSLALIEDSHDVAIKTAEELQYQGEQLDRTEKNLDAIHNDMVVANRNIKSLKSVWGTMANYFKKAPKPTTSQHNEPEPNHVSGMLSPQSLQYTTGERVTDPYGYEGRGASSSDHSSYNAGSLQRSGFSSSRDPYEKALDENLDLMSRGMALLREDALCLGNELERQNHQIGRITEKAENADLKVGKAHGEIRKLL